MRISIWWIRRDLRLTDNIALTAAVKSGDHVLPVFILDPALLNSSYVGNKRVVFLLEGLRHLKADLEARGGHLILREGQPLKELKILIEESGAEGIYAEEDFSPYAKQRDNQIAEELPLHLLSGLTVYHPSAVVKVDGSPYKIYTPFQRAWKSLPFSRRNSLLPIPERISTPPGIESVPFPDPPTLAIKTMFSPGESQASLHLNAFVEGDDPPIYRYAVQRDRIDTLGTSQLSPYLRFGMLSAQQAVNAAYTAIDAAPDQDASESAQTWLHELIWREFYIHILDSKLETRILGELSKFSKKLTLLTRFCLTGRMLSANIQLETGRCKKRLYCSCHHIYLTSFHIEPTWEKLIRILCVVIGPKVVLARKLCARTL